MSCELPKCAQDRFFISKRIRFSDRITYCSEKFNTRNSSIEWRLTVIRTAEEKPAIYITFISAMRSSIKQIHATCTFYISYKKQYCDTQTIYPISDSFIFNKSKEEWIYQLPNKMDIEFDLKVNGVINPTMVDNNKFIDDVLSPDHIETIPINLLHKNLESLLLNQELCDVTFKTSDRLLSAHKSILAAQSPVFKRMFSTDMKEKNPNIVIDMGNIEEVVLKEMFRFMYGGRVENIDKMADKLLILANKYEVELLMNLCEKALYDQLTFSNAISTLKIADSHNAKNLRRLTEEFIIKNKKDLLDTAEFKSLISTNPEIVIDILKANFK